MVNNECAEREIISMDILIFGVMCIIIIVEIIIIIIIWKIFVVAGLYVMCNVLCILPKKNS